MITKQDITEIAAVLDEQAEARRYLRTRADSLCEDAFGSSKFPPASGSSDVVDGQRPALAVHQGVVRNGSSKAADTARVPEDSIFSDLPTSRPWSDDYLKLLASKSHWVQAEIMAFPTGVMARNLAVELAEREAK